MESSTGDLVRTCGLENAAAMKNLLVGRRIDLCQFGFRRQWERRGRLLKSALAESTGVHVKRIVGETLSSHQRGIRETGEQWM
jgi:hypothetical protein